MVWGTMRVVSPVDLNPRRAPRTTFRVPQRKRHELFWIRGTEAAQAALKQKQTINLLFCGACAAATETTVGLTHTGEKKNAAPKVKVRLPAAHHEHSQTFKTAACPPCASGCRVSRRKERLQRIRNLGRMPICPICQEPVLQKQRANKQVVYCEADGRHHVPLPLLARLGRSDVRQDHVSRMSAPLHDLNLKMQASHQFQNNGHAELCHQWPRSRPRTSTATGLDFERAVQVRVRHVLSKFA